MGSDLQNGFKVCLSNQMMTAFKSYTELFSELLEGTPNLKIFLF